ncbi:hypothetical protein JVU11DRAFT_8956 [Chiua virens]|nr:hypothetical protein JVU11DRAFT_8956 [Chiua virens]
MMLRWHRQTVPCQWTHKLKADRDPLSSSTLISICHMSFSLTIASATPGLMVELKVSTETPDVIVMDTLLKAVRARSNPAYHHITPMRNLKTMLWSETLLNSSAPPEIVDHYDLNTVPRITPSTQHA